jgi:uncharacterized protein (TIGR03086 family)
MSEIAGLDLLVRALDQAHAVIAAIRPEQADLPTPCRSWNVSQLTNHVILDTSQFTETARGGAYQPGEGHLEPSSWTAAFEHGAAGLLAAWREQVPLDEAKTNRVSHQITEFAVHSWDIARATGQTRPLDEEIAAHALAWAQRSLKPEHRGDEARGMAFGPEVPASPDAPAADRLAAFSGRRP